MLEEEFEERRELELKLNELKNIQISLLEKEAEQNMQSVDKTYKVELREIEELISNEKESRMKLCENLQWEQKDAYELEKENTEIEADLEILNNEINQIENEVKDIEEKDQNNRINEIRNEYEEKLNLISKKRDNFEEIRRIEKQYEIGIISLMEKEIKIKELMK